MKKLLVLVSAMLCIMLLAFSASAEENVVYVASGGAGDGSTAESPLGTLASAFAAVGEDESLNIEEETEEANDASVCDDSDENGKEDVENG